MDIKDIILRLVVATLLGSIIGVERQIKHHSAGLRTNTLVCIGSASIMILSEYLNFKHFQIYGAVSDPSRMAAQVISGIGFLGAGTIMHSSSSIKGLTTAASLWTVACIGLISGSGYYIVAIVLTILVFLVLCVLNVITRKLSKVHSMRRVTIMTKPNSSVVGEVLYTLNTLSVDMHEIEANVPVDSECDLENAEISFIPHNYEQLQSIIKSIESVDGVLQLVL